MGDYMRGTDLAHLPKEAMALYSDGTESQYAMSPTAAPVSKG